MCTRSVPEWSVVRYLIALGVLVPLVPAQAFALGLDRYQLTPRHMLLRTAEKRAPELPRAAKAPRPAPAFSGHSMDGRLRNTHPRILLPALASWDGRTQPALFRDRARGYVAGGIEAPPVCGVNGGLWWLTVCWVTSGDVAAGRGALEQFRRLGVETPKASGTYGNGWQLALAYDLLVLHPEFSRADRAFAQQRIEQALRNYLLVLDDVSASLWHGRATLAAQAWLCAVALEVSTPEHSELVRRAQGHFLDVVRALGLVEAWPEGYSYWIQNRAMLLALAGAAYLNGVQDSTYSARIRKILERVALWHVYATRPDGFAEGFGDEGTRVDLRDETRPVIDLIAQLTAHPVLATYSLYLQRLHGAASYYRGYRWAFWLFNDPDVLPVAGIDRGHIEGISNWLPHAAIFGRGAMNLAYIHSGWGRDDTFISFRAGNTFTHHGHYDAGHFTLFKGAPLAINSSTSASTMTPHRLNYAIRTVAKNSLLVLRSDEMVQPNRFFEENVADGGQRIVLPTGSAIQSVDHWQKNLGAGLHLEGGRLLHFENVDGEYAYISADLTKAYNNTEHDEGGSGGKVTEVHRELLYLYPEDRLVVHDMVASTRSSYVKKWLLHTVDRPQIADLKLLKGRPDNGILESTATDAMVRNGRGYLHIKALFPRDAVLRLVGGNDYRFYVEVDGDDGVLDGRNFDDGSRQKPWLDHGYWRIELQPGSVRKRDHFLVVLTPSVDKPRSGLITALRTTADNAWVLATRKSLVGFADLGRGESLELSLSGIQQRLYLAGFPPGATVAIRAGGNTITRQATDAGLLIWELVPGAEESVSLAWN